MSGRYNINPALDGNDTGVLNTWIEPIYPHYPPRFPPQVPYAHRPRVGGVVDLSDKGLLDDISSTNDANKLIRDFIKILTDEPDELLVRLRRSAENLFNNGVSVESAKEYVEVNDVLDKVENIIKSK